MFLMKLFTPFFLFFFICVSFDYLPWVLWFVFVLCVREFVCARTCVCACVLSIIFDIQSYYEVSMGEVKATRVDVEKLKEKKSAFLGHYRGANHELLQEENGSSLAFYCQPQYFPQISLNGSCL